MKKLSNMQTLKNLVNADVLECIKCRIYGVQAYNISDNEYEVIVKFAKQGGRYYFIDRDGNRYLASRYDRAEDVAADILENVECTNLAVNALADQIQKYGKVSVNYDFLDLFLNECDRREIEVESVENHYHDNGEMFTVYRLKDEQNAENNAHSEETAADEQDSESEEQQTENEATATNCEPSAFSRILTAVKGYAKKAGTVLAWSVFIAIVLSASLLAVCAAGYAISAVLIAAGLVATTWPFILCFSVLLLSVGLDFAVFVELNTMVIIEKLFPSFFDQEQKARFVSPFSFIGRIYKKAIA